MPINELPRLRPPTFAEPPEGLHQVKVAKGFPDFFKVEIPVMLAGNTGPEELSKIVWYALWDIFGSASFMATSEFKVLLDLSSSDLLEALCREFLLHSNGKDSNLPSISRAWWYQRYEIFMYPQKKGACFEILDPENNQLINCEDKKLQIHLPKPPDTLYERYIDHLDSYFCLSIFGDSPVEVDLLHSWLNDPRVDEYWKDSGDREFHTRWLQDRYEDNHVLPMLGSYRGTNSNDKHAIEPFAYYEIYWAAEDKISQAYSAEPFDRGIHMLVGSTVHRGPHRVSSWLPSLIHYIFSDDPRTKRILSEPDHQNHKMISYLEKFGFKNIKQHDLGHKIAAIMMLEKEDFWKNCSL